MGIASEVRLRDRNVGDGDPIYLVADMASAHGGCRDTAFELVDRAASSGVDAVELQIFATDHWIAPTHESYEDYLALELSPSDWRSVIERALGSGIHVWSHVFDRPSLELALESRVDGLKIQCLDLLHPAIAEMVPRFGRPISLCGGGATPEELELATEMLRRHDVPFLLLHGFQAYPTPVEEAQLDRLRRWKRAYGCPVGYQDHSSADSEHAWLMPALGLGLGANLLQKRFTLERALAGPEQAAALEPGELTRLVRHLRELQGAIDERRFADLAPGETAFREEFGRTIVAARSIRAGEPISQDALAFLRAPHGLPPNAWSDLLGKRAGRDIPRYRTIRAEDIEEEKR